MGRWRDREKNGTPIDATGELPSGAKYNGPVELREALLQQKDEFVRQLTGKVLATRWGAACRTGIAVRSSPSWMRSRRMAIGRAP
ncbi:hypothetical protein SBA4_2060010 [Candidatus Sulfopaludibacter sp. SbA4]|nr:hypothetical protein SBA4_2060010 [Candidatus Sulfopaludibacter sp. SbA4]